MLDWVIVGGGIHGTHLACVLARAGASVRICDPAPTLLHEWRRCTAAVGMTHLRSPVDHDIDAEELSLHHFAEVHAESSNSAAWFAGPRRCPALELFARHCAWVCTRAELDALHLRTRVLELDARATHVHVDTDAGRLTCRRAILAIGSPALAGPRWSRELALATHTFDPRFDPRLAETDAQALVLGSGLSGVQLALRWAEQRPGQVWLIGRRPPVVAEFDADPLWARSRRVQSFARLPLAGRRAVLRSARRRGSIPSRIARRLERAIRCGLVRWRSGEVVSGTRAERGLELELADHERLRVDRLACATGFAEGLIGVELLDRIAERHDLVRDALGVPVIDEALRWHPRVHVSGKLAELQLGPLAPNIAGARLAGARLVRVHAQSQ